MTTHDTLLIFRIDRIACAVAAESVQSIVMPPPHLTQLPGSDKARPGIFRHGEHVFSVIDLHQRFGIEAPRKGVGRLLLYEKGIRRYALWVDEVVGLARHEEGEWVPLPPYLPKTLFQNGFLYQKEIVLCSTLDALLQMQDAEAIRLHLQTLQPAEPKVEVVEESESPITETPSVKNHVVKPSPERPKASAPHTENLSAKRRTTTTQSVTPAKALTPKSKAVAATKKPLPKRPTAPVRRPSNIQHNNKTEAPQTVATQVPAPLASIPKPDNTQANSWPLWLLLIALILGCGGIGGYWMWEKQPTKRLAVKAPAPIQAPVSSKQQQPATPVIPQAPQTVEAPPIIEIAEPTVAPVVVESQPEPKPDPEVVTTKEAAIQIETDSEGTISLIIEREHLRPKLVPQTETPATSKTGIPPQAESQPAPLSKKVITSSSPSLDDAEEGESPLLPDSDWPQPASLPEPCDCTHIVVKGDTLWDIAAKYTNNAFNYPELARQSGIRNPHRIYPGNKVRIIVR